MVKDVIAFGLAVMGFGVSPMLGQWDASLGGGLLVHRLTDWRGPNAGVVIQTTYTKPLASASVGYRLRERVSVRARLDVSEREAFTWIGRGEWRARSIGLGTEGVIHALPWLAVGAGVGYHHLSELPTLGWTGIDIQVERAFGRDLGLRSHVTAHAFAEASAAGLTLRVAPSTSVGRVYGTNFISLDGRTFDRPRGGWLALDLSLHYRVPFGKTRYPTGRPLDQILDLSLGGIERAMGRWSVGLLSEGTAAVLNLGGEGDGYDLRPLRLRSGLQTAYALRPDWRLRLSAGWDVFRADSRLADPTFERPQLRTNFRGLSVMLGAEQRVWRGLYLAADVGAVKVYEEWTEVLEPDDDPWNSCCRGLGADNLPVADYIWLTDLRATYQFGERLRLGAHAQLTLSNANSDSPDSLLEPSRPREGGWLGLGAHASFAFLK